MSSLFGWVRNLLYPNRCIFCEEPMTRTDGLLCCDACERKLAAIGYSHTASGDLSVSWAVYDDTVRMAIHKFKFRNRPQYAHTLAYLMTKALKNLDGFELITWAPTSTLRRLKRGYDQSELLAKELSVMLGLPAARTLKKIKHTKKQSGLNAAERAKNVQNKYRAEENIAAGRKLLVVDDVYTTGATMAECIDTLKRAGAASCIGVTVARTEKSRKKMKEK